MEAINQIETKCDKHLCEPSNVPSRVLRKAPTFEVVAALRLLNHNVVVPQAIDHPVAPANVQIRVHVRVRVRVQILARDQILDLAIDGQRRRAVRRPTRDS